MRLFDVVFKIGLKKYEKLGQKFLVAFELLTVKNPPEKEHRMKKAVRNRKIISINRRTREPEIGYNKDITCIFFS